MKKKIFILLNIIIALCVVCSVYSHLFSVFAIKHGTGKNQIFLSPDEDFDVFLLGTSHMGRIQPLLLWRDYGITSYNLSDDGDGMARKLATLKMALQYHRPRLVVLDTDRFWLETDISENPQGYHKTFDVFPLTYVKLEVLLAMTRDRSVIMEMLFPFYRYHSRYGELEREDYVQPEDMFLGANANFGRHKQECPGKAQRHEGYRGDANPEDMRYIREILELCREQGIEVMLTLLPSAAASIKEQERQHTLDVLGEEYGVRFLNYMDMDPVIDYDDDLRDEGHLNYYGAEKCAVVMGAYIRDNYAVGDHRDDGTVSGPWNERLQKLNAYVERKAKPEE